MANSILGAKKKKKKEYMALFNLAKLIGINILEGMIWLEIFMYIFTQTPP